MKRYEDYGGMLATDDDDGDWVRYEDAQELKRQLDEERARLDWVFEQYGHRSQSGWNLGEGNDYPFGESGDTVREAIDKERSKT